MAKTGEKCMKCGAEEVRFTTLQLRSADEGSTVFYYCDCGHTYVEISCRRLSPSFSNICANHTFQLAPKQLDSPHAQMGWRYPADTRPTMSSIPALCSNLGRFGRLGYQRIFNSIALLVLSHVQCDNAAFTNNHLGIVQELLKGILDAFLVA